MGTVKYASTRFGIVKRSKGQSAIDHASYISRSVIVSEYDGKTYRPKYHEDLVHCEVSLPEHAPEEWKDRAVLWNSVEGREKQKNAQLARTLKAALPNEWSYELAEEVVRDYVKRNFVSKGMCADWAIHDSVNPQGIRNLHFHLMLTLRPVDENGKWGAKQRKEYILDKDGNKIRNKSGRGFKSRAVDVNDWNDKGNSGKWRKDLVDTINAVNHKTRLAEHWEHRSFQEMGVEFQPTIHLGPVASALERQGIETEKGRLNRAIREHNRMLLAARRAYARAEVAVRQLRDAEPVQRMKESAGEVVELIRRVMAAKGKLYLPLVGSPYFHKAANRAELLDAKNVEDFVERQGIRSFQELDVYAKKEENAAERENRQYLSKAEKRRRLQGLAAAFAEYEPYLKIKRERRKRKGLKGIRYEMVHKEELEKAERLKGKLTRLLESGEQINPAQWNKEITELTTECQELSASIGKRQFRLAYVDVVRYNRRMYTLEQKGKVTESREQAAEKVRGKEEKRQTVRKSRTSGMDR